MRRQWIILVFVFICTGFGVWLARSWSNRVQLAYVVIVPHDGVLLKGGLARWQNRLASTEYAGVFYENPDSRMLLPFTGRLDSELLSALQRADSQVSWYNFAPDTLFLRSWSASYAQLIEQLPDSMTVAINKREDELHLLRRLALLSSGARHDSLLKQLKLMPDEQTAAQHDRLYRRYAREMLHSFSKTALRQPGKRWLLIIDVELYPYVKQAFASTPRFGHEG